MGICPVGICPVGICPGVFVLESDENNRKCLPDGRKEMQSAGKIEKESPCQSEESALAWDRQLCLSQW